MNCPTCNQPAKWQDNPFRPFCSERCKLIDFGKWANEEYSIPGHTSPLTENTENALLSPPANSPDTDMEQ
ncbi:MAG: DNA gyrase inhibitor YacG [Acidobacteria bacterium]|nr:DNA gyrase inhibitor YacG [Acidobacteriota bacterium]